LDPLIKSQFPDIDLTRFFSRLWRKAAMLHQKATGKFPTACAHQRYSSGGGLPKAQASAWLLGDNLDDLA
jgi:hypothetical protein